MLARTGRTGNGQCHHGGRDLVEAVRDAAHAQSPQGRRESISEIRTAQQAEGQ